MAAEWRVLWASSDSATPFHAPEWLLPWLRHQYGGGRLWFLALRRAGRLDGLVPLFIWGYPETRRLSLAGSGITDYLDPLIQPGDAAAVVEHLARNRADWEVADLQELRAGSPLLDAPVNSLACEVQRYSVCPVLVLPRSMEEVEAALDARFRTNLRRASNRLERAGRVEFEMAGETSLEEYLDALFRLHGARWNASDEPGMLATARLQSFHREVAAGMLARGMLRFHGLRLDGRLIAVQYNLAAHGREYAYLSGFDPAFAKLSPGMLLVAHAIRSAIAEGSGEFDFLRKAEDFKYLWGAGDRINCQLLLAHDAKALAA